MKNLPETTGISIITRLCKLCNARAFTHWVCRAITYPGQTKKMGRQESAAWALLTRRRTTQDAAHRQSLLQYAREHGASRTSVFRKARQPFKATYPGRSEANAGYAPQKSRARPTPDPGEPVPGNGKAGNVPASDAGRGRIPASGTREGGPRSHSPALFCAIKRRIWARACKQKNRGFKIVFRTRKAVEKAVKRLLLRSVA